MIASNNNVGKLDVVLCVVNALREYISVENSLIW